ncbi:MFS transporter [Labedaea rhizosphaerae]|uniref:Putative MFS family arabinose efflux permease n=1 Tax=Labedaea rhizosphaerae TaxID=598644 RepID=A0A4R6SF61_LABRH|nr:MFS transporter [Labedaea rhizosphaerae]TDQ00194.1 putative MFS family arabinose efflux permease [Labedaea rhizosphaerae]
MAAGGLLRDPDFRRLWLADAVSQLGTRMGQLALPLLVVLTLDATSLEVSLVRVAQTVASLAIGLQVGAWCDRLRCRPVLIAADLARLVLLGSLPLAAVLGVLTLAQVYVVVLLVGAATVFFDVAHLTYLPRLVERDELVEGNAKLRANMSVAAVAAPSLSGVVVQVLTAPVAVLADALSYLWSALWVWRIRAPEPAPPRVRRRPLRAEIAEGVRAVLADPVLRAIAGSNATMAVFQSAQMAIWVVFLVRDIGLSPGTIGVLSTAGLVGALVGSALVRRLTEVVGAARLLWLATLGAGAGFLLNPLTGPGPRLAFAVAASFIASACIIVLVVVQVSFQQAIVPTTLLGRVNGTMNLFYWGGAPVGALLGGLVADQFGARTMLWVAGLGVVASAGWLLASPLRRMRDMPDATSVG